MVFRVVKEKIDVAKWIITTANKYYSSVGHHDQKNKKTTGQIKFLAVTMKQRIKLVLQHSVYK